MQARWICLIGWVVALVVEIYYATQFPPKIVVAGLDVTHDQAIEIVRQFVWLLGGLLLAGAAFRLRRLGYTTVLLSSFLYFAWRYGVGTIHHGIVTDYQMKWVAASGLHYEFTFLVQDVMLPVAFLSAIALALLNIFRQIPTSENR